MEEQHVGRGEKPRSFRVPRGYPIVLAEPATGGQWRFWCPFCRSWHHHGAGEGHRIAHCRFDGNSPFLETGYYLRLRRVDAGLRNLVRSAEVTARARLGKPGHTSRV